MLITHIVKKYFLVFCQHDTKVLFNKTIQFLSNNVPNQIELFLINNEDIYFCLLKHLSVTVEKSLPHVVLFYTNVPALVYFAVLLIHQFLIVVTPSIVKVTQ